MTYFILLAGVYRGFKISVYRLAPQLECTPAVLAVVDDLGLCSLPEVATYFHV